MGRRAEGGTGKASSSRTATFDLRQEEGRSLDPKMRNKRILGMATGAGAGGGEGVRL